MDIKIFNKFTECQNPNVVKEDTSKPQMVKGLFMSGLLALAIGSFIPEEPTTYWFNGPDMADAVLEDNTYNITFEDGTSATVTKETLANEDFSYFGYNSYPINGHQCSVTPRQEIGIKDLTFCSAVTLLMGGVGTALSLFNDKRKNNINQKKQEEQTKRRKYARQRAANLIK